MILRDQSPWRITDDRLSQFRVIISPSESRLQELNRMKDIQQQQPILPGSYAHPQAIYPPSSPYKPPNVYYKQIPRMR